MADDRVQSAETRTLRIASWLLADVVDPSSGKSDAGRCLKPSQSLIARSGPSNDAAARHTETAREAQISLRRLPKSRVMSNCWRCEMVSSLSRFAAISLTTRLRLARICAVLGGAMRRAEQDVLRLSCNWRAGETSVAWRHANQP